MKSGTTAAHFQAGEGTLVCFAHRLAYFPLGNSGLAERVIDLIHTPSTEREFMLAVMSAWAGDSSHPDLVIGRMGEESTTVLVLGGATVWLETDEASAFVETGDAPFAERTLTGALVKLSGGGANLQTDHLTFPYLSLGGLLPVSAFVVTCARGEAPVLNTGFAEIAPENEIGFAQEYSDPTPTRQVSDFDHFGVSGDVFAVEVDEVGVDEVGVDEVGVDEVGVDEVGAAVVVADTDLDDPSLSKEEADQLAALLSGSRFVEETVSHSVPDGQSRIPVGPAPVEDDWTPPPAEPVAATFMAGVPVAADGLGAREPLWSGHATSVHVSESVGDKPDYQEQQDENATIFPEPEDGTEFRRTMVAKPSPLYGSDASDLTLIGAYCGNGHFTDSRKSRCLFCGADVDDDRIEIAPRPVLGVLRFESGDIVDVNGTIVLGRLPVSSRPGDLLIPIPTDRRLSRVHCEIRTLDWDVVVVDRQSANGTVIEHLDGRRIVARPNLETMLEHGSRVIVGSTTLVFGREAANRGS